MTSVGGHLTDLYGLLPRFKGLDPEHTWVTFDTPQSRSLLEGEDVVFVDYTSPRDFKNVVRHSTVAMRMLRPHHPFTAVVSTGSGIALSFLPLGRARGASCHYIECSARADGPSLTGRLLSRIPGIALYSQYPSWAEPPWRYRGSILESYVPGRASATVSEVRRVVVTLGTMTYPFRRLVERTIEILPAGIEVVWQVGHTEVEDLPIPAQRWLPADELKRAIEVADVVIAHAGSGSSFVALDAGKCPILIPRLKAYGENVDDHQLEIAAYLAQHDLAIVRSIDELTTADLHEAASRYVRRSHQPPPFRLAADI